jgi:DNA/RNA-binding domain of Phe-tRNA-synthetase-like protein
MTTIEIKLPGVKLGIVEAEQVRVGPADSQLANLMDQACDRKRAGLTTEAVAEAEPTRAVRAMFRAWGVDPSKYRPSSEALLRRAVQGKGLYRVSNLVDIGNLGSIETGWPFGCYDRAQLYPPVAFRHGSDGEAYQGIGKRVWHLEGRPVLADANGPFGSPISDSTRSMITPSATSVLAVIYAPSATPDAKIDEAMAQLCERLCQFAAADGVHAAICQ